MMKSKKAEMIETKKTSEKEKKIHIFIDMGHKFGMGHFSRASALVDAFLEQNWRADFFINSDTELSLPKKPKVNYFKSDWLAQAPVDFCDLIVIDSYSTKADFIQKLARQKPETPCVILENFQGLNYPQNYLIHNSSLPPLKNKNFGSTFVNDLKYLLIRKEFWHQKQKPTGALEKILLIFGGSDIRELSLPVAKMLKREFKNLQLTIVIGSFAKKELLNDLEKIVDSKLALALSPKGEELAQIMADSDLAISAAGQTMYEIAASCLPVISVEIVDNQSRVNETWQKLAIAQNGGDYKDAMLMENIKKLVQLMHSKTEREKMSNNQKKLIDGKGAIRSRDLILNHFNL